VILAASLAAALVALLAFTLIDRSTALFFAAMFAYGGAAFSLYPLCIANANDHCESSRYVATASGLLLVYGIGAAVGPLLAGILLQMQGPRSLPLFLAATQLVLALFASLRKLVKASPPPEAREPFVMLGRSSQSALDVLAPTAGQDASGAARRG
jgi:MFS family permease